MTGGQASLGLGADGSDASGSGIGDADVAIRRLPADSRP